jgi:hypothetical protein
MLCVFDLSIDRCMTEGASAPAAVVTGARPAEEAKRQQVPCVNSASVGTDLLSQSPALDPSIVSSSHLASNGDGEPSPALKHRLKHITTKFSNPKVDRDPSLRLSATSACSWKFTRYESSKWEREWLDALDSRVPNPCAAMAASDFIERGRRLLQRNMQLIDSYVSCASETFDLCDPSWKCQNPEQSVYRFGASPLCECH